MASLGPIAEPSNPSPNALIEDDKNCCPSTQLKGNIQTSFNLASAALNVQDVGRQVLESLNAGYSGARLLHEMGRAMLWDDTNTEVLPTLRTVFEEWELCAGHPARYQLMVGLARYATDIRTNKDSG